MPTIRIKLSPDYERAVLKPMLEQLSSSASSLELPDFASIMGAFVGPPERARRSVPIDQSLDGKRVQTTINMFAAYQRLALAKIAHLRLAFESFIDLRDVDVLAAVASHGKCGKSRGIGKICIAMAKMVDLHRNQQEWAAAANIIEVFRVAERQKTGTSAHTKISCLLIDTRIKRDLQALKDDKVLTCADCRNGFVFTRNEQTFFRSKGFSQPKRCNECRKKKKAQHLGQDRLMY